MTHCEESLAIIGPTIKEQEPVWRALDQKEEELRVAIKDLRLGYRKVLGEVIGRFIMAVPGASELRLGVHYESDYNDEGGTLEYLSYSFELYNENGEEIPLEDEAGCDLDLDLNDELSWLLNSSFSLSDVGEADSIEVVFKNV